MTDPRFPNRPDHPDFWLMSEAIIDLDAASEKGMPFQEVIGDVDLDSLSYAAQQRALARAVKILGPPVTREALAMATWVDGFMAGARFHELKQRRSKAQDFWKGQDNGE